MLKRHAFTLIELLIVLTIVGIAALVVVPMVSSHGEMRLSAAARKVVADLQYAQNMAVASQRTYYIRFDDVGYDLARSTGASTEPEQVVHPVEKTPFVVGFAAQAKSDALAAVAVDSVDFAGRSVLRFDATGSPGTSDPDGDDPATLGVAGVIVLRSGDRTINIRVEPFTGEISVE